MAVTVHRSEVTAPKFQTLALDGGVWLATLGTLGTLGALGTLGTLPGYSLRPGKEKPFPMQKVRRSPETIRAKWLKEMSPVSTEIELLPSCPSGHSLDIILKSPTSHLGITKEKGTCLLALCTAICLLLLCVFRLLCHGYISLKLTCQFWGQTPSPQIKDRRIW